MVAKIALIGAGSAVFSLNLVRDLCLTPNLGGSVIHFMDINESRLSAVAELCRRYAAEVGTALEIHQTTDRRSALAGADFVINTALAAGHDRLQAGWEVARQLGYRFGGSLHILHDEAFWINFYQYRLFESLAEDMLEICPKAFLLLVANPVLAGITHLGRKYPGLKAVGLCHGYSGINHVARVIGLDPDQITFQIPGVNHFVWLTHLYHQGQDAFPLLDEWIETKSQDYFAQCDPGDSIGPVAVDLYRRFGVFPIGDTCTAGGGSWPYWYHSDDETEKTWREDPAGWWRWYFEHMTDHVAEIERVSADRSSKVSEAFPPKKSGEVMIPLIESIACDIPRVLIGNIPNSASFVPGVPQDIAVEIPLLCSARGIQGIQTTGLPPTVVSYLLRDRVAPVNLELLAYTTGDRKALVALILTDPFTHSLAQAETLVERILSLDFHAKMRAHFGMAGG
jgi:alpha-galactosidase